MGMKYWLITLGILTIPFKSFAVSGACSGHGGVNCSVISSDNAICNDGWVSSTNYYNTDECQINSCGASPVQPDCNVDELRQEEQEAKGKWIAIAANSGMLGGSFSFDSSPYDEKIANCETANDEYNSDIIIYNSCLNNLVTKPTDITPPPPQVIDISCPIGDIETTTGCQNMDAMLAPFVEHHTSTTLPTEQSTTTSIVMPSNITVPKIQSNKTVIQQIEPISSKPTKINSAIIANSTIPIQQPKQENLSFFNKITSFFKRLFRK